MSAIEPVTPRDPRVPVSPQLALRVTIIGGLAMVMFGVIFFRLWFLQVLSSEQYVQQANANGARELPIAAPRGQILDREGQPLVGSTVTNAVQIVPDELPAGISSQVAEYQERLYAAEAARQTAAARLASYEASLLDPRHPTRAQRLELGSLRAAARPPRVAVPALPRSDVALAELFRHLGHVIGVSPRTIDERVVEGMTAAPYAHVTIKTAAGPGPLTVLGERASEFPGVVQEPVSIREYPYGEMAAQILGYVGQVSTTELESCGLPRRESRARSSARRASSTTTTTTCAASRASSGWRSTPKASPCQPASSRRSPRAAVTRCRPRSTCGLQRASEKALLEGMEHARAGGKPAVAGAFVALDPLNGEVLAMGSSPSFNPDRFAKPLTYREYAELSSGVDGVARPADRPGRRRRVPHRLDVQADHRDGRAGSGRDHAERRARRRAVHLRLHRAILQRRARRLRGGRPRGSAEGLLRHLLLRSRQARQRTTATSSRTRPTSWGSASRPASTCRASSPAWCPTASGWPNRTSSNRSASARTTASRCYIVAEPGAPWTVGYNMDLAVGQGELLTDPLQMAVAYSTLANAYRNGGNGTVVTPHLGKQIDEASGSLLQTLHFPSRHVHLDYEDLSLVMEGIHEAASEPGGTSADVWTGWNQEKHPVYGKTGTAERAGHVEQSWYMCYIADPKRPIVIAVTVEEGGFGAETAAPIARLIASQWFGVAPSFVAGTSKTF